MVEIGRKNECLAMSMVKNETLKLMANWCNAASVTISGAGVVLPVLSEYFHFGQPVTDSESIWSLVVIGATAAICLHLLGQLVLGGLDEQP
jgi:hypothetical protein